MPPRLLGRCDVLGSCRARPNTFGGVCVNSLSQKNTGFSACMRQDVCYSFYRTKTFPGGAVVAQLTVNQRVAGSNPARGAIFPGGAVVAQLTVNQRVAGSNPARGARSFEAGRVALPASVVYRGGPSRPGRRGAHPCRAAFVAGFRRRASPLFVWRGHGCVSIFLSCEPTFSEAN